MFFLYHSWAALEAWRSPAAGQQPQQLVLQQQKQQHV
jgi:hypothetical protein